MQSLAVDQGVSESGFQLVGVKGPTHVHKVPEIGTFLYLDRFPDVIVEVLPGPDVQSKKNRNMFLVLTGQHAGFYAYSLTTLYAHIVGMKTMSNGWMYFKYDPEQKPAGTSSRAASFLTFQGTTMSPCFAKTAHVPTNSMMEIPPEMVLMPEVKARLRVVWDYGTTDKQTGEPITYQQYLAKTLKVKKAQVDKKESAEGLTREETEGILLLFWGWKKKDTLLGLHVNLRHENPPIGTKVWYEDNLLEVVPFQPGDVGLINNGSVFMVLRGRLTGLRFSTPSVLYRFFKDIPRGRFNTPWGTFKYDPRNLGDGFTISEEAKMLIANGVTWQYDGNENPHAQKLVYAIPDVNLKPADGNLFPMWDFNTHHPELPEQKLSYAKYIAIMRFLDKYRLRDHKLEETLGKGFWRKTKPTETVQEPWVENVSAISNEGQQVMDAVDSVFPGTVVAETYQDVAAFLRGELPWAEVNTRGEARERQYLLAQEMEKRKQEIAQKKLDAEKKFQDEIARLDKELENMNQPS